MVHYMGSALASDSSSWEATEYSVEDRFRYYFRTLSEMGFSKVVPIFRRKGGSFCFRLVELQDDQKKSRWSHWMRVETISGSDKSHLNEEIQMCLTDIKCLEDVDVRDYSLFKDFTA